MSSADLKERWNKFYLRPFPAGYGGTDVNGICVTSTDSYAAGCIDSFIKGGSLDSKEISILQRCQDDLAVVLPGLEGQAQKYFSELAFLADEVLTQVVR